MIFPLVSAVSLTDTTLTSSGLNSSIIFSSLNATCDNFTVGQNYIYFGNLQYDNPTSCSDRDGIITTVYLTYNYTTVNTNITDLQLPHTICDANALSNRNNPFHAGYLFLIAMGSVISLVLLATPIVLLIKKKISIGQFFGLLFTAILGIWVAGLFIISVT